MGVPPRRAVPPELPIWVPAPRKPCSDFGGVRQKTNMGAHMAPGKRCFVEHRATEWHSPDPPPARMTGPGAVRWPNKKEPHTPGICAHTRAHGKTREMMRLFMHKVTSGASCAPEVTGRSRGMSQTGRHGSPVRFGARRCTYRAPDRTWKPLLHGHARWPKRLLSPGLGA